MIQWALLLILFYALNASAICRTKGKNIILILTDDQDVELGSMQFMPKTKHLLQERGVTFNGGFVSTPICCPSRTSILTGQYVHNHHVFTNNQNCSGPDWRNIYEKRTFGVYLQEKGYVTAYFGKYLNEYDGSYLPPGWTEWMGLIKNSRFYNYTINFNGEKIKHGFDYERDYFTDLIANDTIAFLNRHCERQPTKPFLAVLSFPAPHGPEDPAPQYSNLFENVETHRTPSWNYAPNPDKQWILQYTGRMEPIHVVFTDLLHRRRLQTLQSVDQNIQRVYNELRDIGVLSQTYIIYSSDHGYHLGQYGLVKGKNMPYEFDIRVPYFIRGPELPRNITVREPVMNVDIAPTILDMAGVTPPNHMDGCSLLPLMRTYGLPKKKAAKAVKWRHTILIERGKMTKLKNLRDRLQNQTNDDGVSDRFLIRSSCQRVEFSGNCDETQEWKCVNVKNRWIAVKCHETVDIEEDCPCSETRKVKTEEGTDQQKVIDHRKTRRLGTLSDLYKLDAKIVIDEKLMGQWRTDFLHFVRQKELSERKRRHSDFSVLFEADKRNNRKKSQWINRSSQMNQELASSEADISTSANETYLCGPVFFTNYRVWRRTPRILPFASKGRSIRIVTNYKGGRRRRAPGDAPKCRCNAFRIYQTIIEEVETASAEVSEEETTKANRRKAAKGFQIGTKKSQRPDTRAHCHVPQMNCFTHGPDHWRTPPLWPAVYGEFCFCQGANNNTYWCLRTLNDTHNFLYCEFITEFVSYYDLNTDPYQLKNTVWSVPLGILEQLNKQLGKLHRCKGAKECEHYSSQNWDRPFNDT